MGKRGKRPKTKKFDKATRRPPARSRRLPPPERLRPADAELIRDMALANRVIAEGIIALCDKSLAEGRLTQDGWEDD